MSVLVGFHLGQAEHCVLALPAVVVRLLAVVGAVGDVAHLGGGVLLEARRDDRVQLLVLPAVGHHLVGVGAVVIALEAVEMTRALGRLSWQSGWKKRENKKVSYSVRLQNDKIYKYFLS